MTYSGEIKGHGLKFLLGALVVSAILATLIVTPGISYDPINLPKMLVVATGASIMLSGILLNIRAILKFFPSVSGLLILFSASLIGTFLLDPTNWSQQIWGTWGRSTGLLTYLAFIIIFLSAAILTCSINLEIIRKVFEKLSYFVSTYTLLQAADLDPINWSQKLMVATLGNINFMSSFVGLASISMFVRILNERNSVTSRIFYAFVIGLNLFLIWHSESIQGIAVFLSGVAVSIAFWIRLCRGAKPAFVWICSAIPIGILALMGTAGLGPLASLRQETVIFRLDYWRAGLRMTLDNWLTGIGIDSYGDFYQQYRDQLAATRTGPQRVTNTAHNVFLDVSSGSGVIAGLLFLFIFVHTLILIARSLKSGTFSSSEVSFSCIFVGYFVFCLISINQIGVAVWGFIAAGCVQGAFVGKILHPISTSRSKAYFKKVEFEQNQKFIFPIFKLKIISALLGSIGFVISLVPVIVDARVLQAIQNENLSEYESVVESDLSANFHRTKYLSLLVDSEQLGKAYEFASFEILRNPRSEFGQRVVAFSEIASEGERLAAIQALRKIDPMNSKLMSQLTELEIEILRD